MIPRGGKHAASKRGCRLGFRTVFGGGRWGSVRLISLKSHDVITHRGDPAICPLGTCVSIC